MTLNLKAPPVEPNDVRFPINLATALRLSDARPLIVAATQAKVWVAEAELSQAKVLWIPTLTIGFDYIRLDGGGPDFNKGILTSPSTNFFYAGAGLTGAPLGLIYTTDAIYEPLAAWQVLNSRQWDIQAAKNDALLQTANAYFKVHENRGMYAGTLFTVARGHELVSRLATLSAADLVSAGTRSTEPVTCWPTSSKRPPWRGSSGASRVPNSRECSGSTRARWSSRWSTTTSRSPWSTRPVDSTT